MTRHSSALPWLGIAGALAAAEPAHALFHLAHIAEVNAKAGSDANDQYVEIEMEAPAETRTKNSVLAAFDCDGTFLGDLLVVPEDVPNGGTGVRWIMATLDSTGGIIPDFVIPADAPDIPADCGQVCWGAPGNLPPADPNSWSRTNLSNFVDCVAYGPYTGPTRPGSGLPSPFTPGGGTYALERLSDTAFTLACPSPENNDGTVGDYGFCPEPTTTSTIPGISTSTTTVGTTSTTTTTVAPPAEERLGGGLLLRAQPAKPTKSRLKLRSIETLGDELTLGGGPGSADDPTLHGGQLSVFSSVPSTFVNTYPLDATTGTWTAKRKRGAQIGWTFKGSSGPITKVTIIDSRSLTAAGKGAELNLQLPVDPRPVGVILEIGGHSYCFEFGNGPTFFAPDKRFRAAKNPPPETCPAPP